MPPGYRIVYSDENSEVERHLSSEDALRYMDKVRRNTAKERGPQPREMASRDFNAASNTGIVLILHVVALIICIVQIKAKFKNRVYGEFLDIMKEFYRKR